MRATVGSIPLLALGLTAISVAQSQPAGNAESRATPRVVRRIRLDCGLEAVLAPHAPADACAWAVGFRTDRSHPSEALATARLFAAGLPPTGEPATPPATFLARYAGCCAAEGRDDWSLAAASFSPRAAGVEIESVAARFREFHPTRDDVAMVAASYFVEEAHRAAEPRRRAVTAVRRLLAAGAAPPECECCAPRQTPMTVGGLDALRVRCEARVAPANAYLAVVGPFEIEDMERRIRAAFAAIPAGRPAPRAPAPPPGFPGVTTMPRPRKSLEPVQLAVGWPTPRLDDGLVVLLVFGADLVRDDGEPFRMPTPAYAEEEEAATAFLNHEGPVVMGTLHSPNAVVSWSQAAPDVDTAEAVRREQAAIDAHLSRDLTDHAVRLHKRSLRDLMGLKDAGVRMDSWDCLRYGVTLVRHLDLGIDTVRFESQVERVTADDRRRTASKVVAPDTRIAVVLK